MNDMNMDWFMLIRVEIKDKPEVFKYLRHSNIICYFIDKDITISFKYQNSFKQMFDLLQNLLKSITFQTILTTIFITVRATIHKLVASLIYSC